MLHRIVLVSSLLGLASFTLHVDAFRESQEASVSVRPPGSNIYLGESVWLQCAVTSPRCASVRSYQWYRSKRRDASNPRHLTSGDGYSITAVTSEDADSYWCRAECGDNRTRLAARPVELSVSEQPPPSLSLTPSTRQMLRGERFTVRCPTSETPSSGWRLMYFSPGRAAAPAVLPVRESPPGGGVSAEKPEGFVSTASSETSGLYWCEGTQGRSNAVNITVSYANITLKTPAFPVFTGDDVVLSCHYQTGDRNNTRFLKNGAEIEASSSSSSGGVTKMALRNVTRDDEGLYRCSSHDGRMQSPESWLSVRPDTGNVTSTAETVTSSGSWKWVIASCGVILLVLIPLSVWLVYHYRFRFSTRSCWPVSTQDVPVEALPATTQDVTEVQWDLSWMEMSNLLDKDVYCGT